MTINKYKLYIIVLLLVCGLVTAPRAYCLLTYERTEGLITGFQSVRTGRHSKTYPVVEFDSEKYHVTFYAPSYMHEAVRLNQVVPVIYDAAEPTSAYVVNFYGLWSGSFIILLPFFLVWSGCIFAIGFMPTNIQL